MGGRGLLSSGTQSQTGALNIGIAGPAGSQSSAGLDSIAEPRCGAGFRFYRFLFAILRRRIRFERMNQTTRGRGYFVDSGQERGLICFRRFGKTADFSNELQRGILDLVGSNWRIEVEKWSDVPAHSYDLNETCLNPLWCFVDGGDQGSVSLIRSRSPLCAIGRLRLLGSSEALARITAPWAQRVQRDIRLPMALRFGERA